MLHILSARSKQKHGTAAAFFDLDFSSVGKNGQKGASAQMMRGHNISTPFIRVTTSYPFVWAECISAICTGQKYLSRSTGMSGGNNKKNYFDFVCEV